MRKLTGRQRLVLAAIDACTQRHGYPPTMGEIAREVGIVHKSGTVCHLLALEKKGFISRKRQAARAIAIVCRDDGDAVLEGGVWHERP